MDTKKKHSERKRVLPYTNPRSQRLVVQIYQKKYYRGRKPIKPHILILVSKSDNKIVEYRIT